MPLVSRISDHLDHDGAVIITGSGVHLAEGMPVARLTDLVYCPLVGHGVNPIVNIPITNIYTDDLMRAHVMSVSECGAVVITGATTVMEDSGSPSTTASEVQMSHMGQDDPEARQTTLSGVGGGSGSAQRSRFYAPEVQTSETDTTQPPQTQGTPTDCSRITEPVPDDFRLSRNFTLAMLSTAARVSSYKVTAQNGLTAAQIVCNLKALAENVLEPLLARFPGMFVTSGFRAGTGSSQHNVGQAADIQWSDIFGNRRGYYERAQWIRDNLPFDQLILEYSGSSVWIHVSYNSNNLRRSVLTMTTPGQYRQGLLV